MEKERERERGRENRPLNFTMNAVDLYMFL
jgi:hypothetical protein